MPLKTTPVNSQGKNFSLSSGNATNIEAILVQHEDQQVIIQSKQEITKFKHQLVFKKKTNSLKHELQTNTNLQTGFLFSMFMGLFQLKDNVFLVFVESVREVSFSSLKIYEVKKIKVFALNNFKEQPEFSQLFTKYFKEGYLFSFDIDLSFGDNFRHYFQGSASRASKNLLFMTNINMVQPFLHEKGQHEWAVSLVNGRIEQGEIWDSVLKQKCVMTLFYKKSIFCQFQELQQDLTLNNIFYFGNQHESLDIFIGEQQNLRYQQYLFTSLPNQGDRDVEAFQNAEYFSNPARINKFLQFLKEYENVDVFFIDSNQAWEEFQETFAQDSQEFFFISKIEHFFSKIQHIIQKGLITNKTMKYCVVSDENRKNWGQLINQIWEPIQETPHVANFRKRSSSFDLTFLNNIHLNAPKDQIENFIKLVKLSNEQQEQRLLAQKEQKKNMNLEFKGSFESLVIGTNLANHLIKILEKIDSIFLDQPLKVAFLTHNCSGLPEVEDLTQLIKYKSQEDIQQCDVLIIGLQELLEMKKKNLTNIITNENEGPASVWEKNLKQCFSEFILVGNSSMLGLMLLIFQKKNWTNNLYIQIQSENKIKQGFLYLANKGAIFIQMKLNWQTLGIVNCHLASGNSKKDFQKRLENLKEIKDFLKEQNSDLKVIMGDFNWRNQMDLHVFYSLLNQYKESSDPSFKYQILQKMMENQEFSQKNKSVDEYLENIIEFLPSYKWKPFSNEYNSNEGKQIPSWTDRIFFNPEGLQIFAPIKYELHEETCFSDHKPVFLIVSCCVKTLNYEKLKDCFNN